MVPTVDRNDVSELHAQVFANSRVQTDLVLIKTLICKHNANCDLATNALQKHIVALHQAEPCHLRGGEKDHRIVGLLRVESDGICDTEIKPTAGGSWHCGLASSFGVRHVRGQVVVASQRKRLGCRLVNLEQKF